MIMNSKPVYLNPNLPFQDINRANWRDLVSGMSPFIKVFGESLPKKGYSLFLDRPIESFEGEPSDILPFISKKQENVVTTLLPTVGKVSRLFAKHKEGELTAQAISEFLGVKLMNVDPQRTLRSQTYARRELLRAMKKQAEAEGIVLPPAKRRRKRRRKRGGGSGLGSGGGLG
tara:strand:- start:1323 stop:1841 length:519 start_codon:yes stop_codon:yes gene_type:complete